MSQLLHQSRRGTIRYSTHSQPHQCLFRLAVSLLQIAHSAAKVCVGIDPIMMRASVACTLAVLSLCLVAGVSAGDWRNGKSSPQREPATLSYNYVRRTFTHRHSFLHAASNGLTSRIPLSVYAMWAPRTSVNYRTVSHVLTFNIVAAAPFSAWPCAHTSGGDPSPTHGLSAEDF